MINDPLKYVAVPYAELQALLEMARNVSKNSPWGQSDTQPWNPEIKQLAELGDEVPTIAGVIGESNTVLISMPDIEALKAMMPYIGVNGNWHINGIDTGVKATPDTSKVLRPHMVIEQPVVTATANQDELAFTGGKVTVFDGISSVKEVLVSDATLTVFEQAMVVCNSTGVLSAVANTLPVIDAVPVFYITHTAHGVVDLVNVVPAILASELCYYAQALKQLDLTNLNNLNNLLHETIQAISTAQIAAVAAVVAAQEGVSADLQAYLDAIQEQINALLGQASATLLGVPRVLSFCHFNDAEYVSGSTIAYFKVDHSFIFPNDFAGSLAAFTLKGVYTTNPEIAILAIYVNNVRIGSVQINTDNSIVFIMYEEGYSVNVGDILSFKVDIMTYIASITLTMLHTLGA